jgi:hypothetical protein
VHRFARAAARANSRDRGEKIAMSHKMLRQKSQGHVVDVLQMQKDAAEGKVSLAALALPVVSV